MMEQHYLELGMRMRLRRRELHLTQKELAALCHVSANHISAVESAKEKPSLDMLILLCDALRTTPDFLLLGSSYSLPATAKHGTGKTTSDPIFLQPG